MLLPGATQALPADVVATLKKEPALIIISTGSPHVVHLKQGKRIILGRDKACDIALADVAISRRHAEVVAGPNGFYIRDLGSANGVRVNQIKIDNPYLLAHSDRIMIGGIVIYYMNLQQEDYANALASAKQGPPAQSHKGVIASDAKDTDEHRLSSVRRLKFQCRTFLRNLWHPSGECTNGKQRSVRRKYMQIQPLKKVAGIQHRTDLRPLTEDEINFEIDMCIGCDRCMRACPIPMSSTVTIADLNRATISEEITPHVALFTDECVMCGSCVPVCPVDNHRDLLMLSLKQRLGISWDGTVDMSKILNFLPAGWNTALLLSRLREQPMFSDTQLIPENYLLHMVATSKILTMLPGTVVMHEGEFGREMYYILEGRFEVSSTGIDGTQLPVAILRRGEYMGERGMLTGQQRNATIRAQTAAVVLEVPEQVMQHLMEIVPAVRRFFEQLNISRSIEAIIKRMALFQGVSASDIHTIAEQTEVRAYEREERLFSEGGASATPARESLHSAFRWIRESCSTH